MTPTPDPARRRAGVAAATLALVAGLLVSLGATAAPTASATPAASSDQRQATTSARSAPKRLAKRERAVITRVNRQRRANGCKPLKRAAPLVRASRRHSDLMAQHQSLNHQLPGEPPLWNRVRQAGYRDASMVGENVAVGQRTAKAVVRAWMRSPSHRAQILNCRFRHSGVGLTMRQGVAWWTQTFARR